jgi:hypothetical protein
VELPVDGGHITGVGVLACDAVTHPHGEAIPPSGTVGAASFTPCTPQPPTRSKMASEVRDLTPVTNHHSRRCRGIDLLTGSHFRATDSGPSFETGAHRHTSCLSTSAGEIAEREAVSECVRHEEGCAVRRVCLQDTAQNRQPTVAPTPITWRVRSRSTAR